MRLPPIMWILLSLIMNGTVLCHKIVYLVSPPRSLSVAFLRMMEARGDFIIMNEPSIGAWSLIHSHTNVKAWFLPEGLISFEHVKNNILKTAQCGNVFAKEISFSVCDFHRDDLELMKHPDVYFIFLMRNPHHTTISLYKRLIDAFDQITTQQMSDFGLGYKETYDLFMVAQHHAANKPHIILAEDLCQNPAAVIEKFCTHVGIDFKPESLHWQDLGKDFDGRELWHEIKHKETIHHWHGDAIASTTFGTPTVYEVDLHGNPTFSEIINLDHRTCCQRAYEKHLPYYELLKQYCMP